MFVRTLKGRVIFLLVLYALNFNFSFAEISRESINWDDRMRGDSLYLSGLSLNEIPSFLEGDARISSLILNNNNLVVGFSDVEVLKSMPNLVELYLENNQINENSKGLSRLMEMQGLGLLSLSENQLRRMPEINGSSIMYLFLDGNIFSRIPSELEVMSNLRLLDISDQSIDNFDEAVKFLPRNLNELYLNSTSLQEIPTGIDRLVTLEILSVKNNRIESIPTTIWRMKRLREIDLEGNPIRDYGVPFLNLNTNLKINGPDDKELNVLQRYLFIFLAIFVSVSVCALCVVRNCCGKPRGGQESREGVRRKI